MTVVDVETSERPAHRAVAVPPGFDRTPSISLVERLRIDVGPGVPADRQADPAESWRPKGCTSFGARLLAELALEFAPPA
jgi:hypothetical protein